MSLKNWKKWFYQFSEYWKSKNIKKYENHSVGFNNIKGPKKW